MIVIFRFSFLSGVIESAKNGTLTYPLRHYLNEKSKPLLKLDTDKIPADYNGDNYDLIFDKDFNFIKAEKDLDKSEALKQRGKK